MGGSLTTEVPSLHGTLITLTLGDGLDVHKLSDLEVTRTQAVPNRKEVLGCHGELSQMSLGRQVEFKEVTSLRLLQVLHSFLSHTDLDRVDSVLLESLDLCDLASIDLKDCAWHDLAPLVPEVSHSHLVPKEADSPGVTIGRSSWLQLELLVDFIFKACE